MKKTFIIIPPLAFLQDTRHLPLVLRHPQNLFVQLASQHVFCLSRPPPQYLAHMQTKQMRITALLFQSCLVWRGLTMVLTDFLLGIPRGVACCGCVYLPLFPRWSLTTAPKPYGFTAYGRRCRSCVICSCSKDCKFVSRATMHARRADKGICLKVRSRCRSRW